MHNPSADHCAVCESPINQPTGRGRPRRYCSKRCGAIAYKSRHGLLRAPGWCSECGQPLVQPSGKGRRRVCCAGCKNRRDVRLKMEKVQ